MNKKCSKYEGLFIFSDEETLLKHLEECPDCRAEHEKMQKVSELIRDTKFYYKSKSKKTRKLRAICMLVLFMFFTATFGVIHNSEELRDVLLWEESLTAEDLGFPVDSYGLLMVDNEF